MSSTLIDNFRSKLATSCLGPAAKPLAPTSMANVKATSHSFIGCCLGILVLFWFLIVAPIPCPSPTYPVYFPYTLLDGPTFDGKVHAVIRTCYAMRSMLKPSISHRSYPNTPRDF